MPNKTGIKIKCCTVCESEDIEIKGNKYYCNECDIEYKVTAQGTKPFDTNPKDKEKARIDKIEKDVAELKGKEPDQSGANGEADIVDLQEGDKEDEDESDGFITW